MGNGYENEKPKKVKVNVPAHLLGCFDDENPWKTLLYFFSAKNLLLHPHGLASLDYHTPVNSTLTCSGDNI